MDSRTGRNVQNTGQRVARSSKRKEDVNLESDVLREVKNFSYFLLNLNEGFYQIK